MSGELRETSYDEMRVLAVIEEALDNGCGRPEDESDAAVDVLDALQAMDRPTLLAAFGVRIPDGTYIRIGGQEDAVGE